MADVAAAQVIVIDMIPFMTILLCAMIGCTLFFSINLPSSPEFRPDDSLGVFRPLVTVYHMALGIGQADFSTASVMTVMMVTTFMSFVVVVL